MRAMTWGDRPLILHVIHRFAVGGLEAGLVNLINHMPPEKYRHAVLCIDAATNFSSRLNRDVEIVELRKRAGKDWASYGRLARIIRALKPAVMHTRNYGTLDTQVVAATNGVPRRIHGEHGSDVFDADRILWKCNAVRRAVRPLVHAYIAVSPDLAAWLTSVIHVPDRRVHYIPNGVDATRFHCSETPLLSRQQIGLGGRYVIGTVGRMETVKNQLFLVEAFITLTTRRPDLRARLGLVLVGDGPVRTACLERLAAFSLLDAAYVPGRRDDIPELLRLLDVFVLPSSSEGMSNAILEAMASELPVIATNVGGNRQAVHHGVTGTIVTSGDVLELSGAIETYADHPEIARQHGRTGRAVIGDSFDLRTMVESYVNVYDSVLTNLSRTSAGSASAT